MTEDTAKRSIDWLHSIGSRVLALMGGEPLLRPKFIHKIVHYSAKKDIFVYLPTNGRSIDHIVLHQAAVLRLPADERPLDEARCDRSSG